MKYIIITLSVLLLLLFVASVVFYRLYKKFRKSYEEEHLQLINLQQEYSNLVEAYKIKKENKEKADEKISDLHSGTVSADDILPKRKSRK